MTKEKISPSALICILLCARSFTTMTIFPPGTAGGLIYMTGSVISTALQAVMLVPAAKLAARTGRSPCRLAYERSKYFGITVTAAFMLYFLYDAFRVIGDLAYFTDYFFSANMPRFMIVLCIALAAVCSARLEITAIGRTAFIAFAGVIIMLAIIAMGAAEDMDITRFDLASESLAKDIRKAVMAESSRCGCLVIFCFLCGDISGDPQKTAKFFISAKAAVLLAISGMTTAVFGNFGMLWKLPVFSLAASSENLITERSDAVFLFIWVITGLVKLTVLVHCAARCLRLLRPSAVIAPSAMICGILPALAALPLLLCYGWEKVVYSHRPITPIIILAVILPAYILLGQKAAYRGTEA